MSIPIGHLVMSWNSSSLSKVIIEPSSLISNVLKSDYLSFQSVINDFLTNFYQDVMMN